MKSNKQFNETLTDTDRAYKELFDRAKKEHTELEALKAPLAKTAVPAPQTS